MHGLSDLDVCTVKSTFRRWNYSTQDMRRMLQLNHPCDKKSMKTTQRKFRTTTRSRQPETENSKFSVLLAKLRKELLQTIF